MNCKFSFSIRIPLYLPEKFSLQKPRSEEGKVSHDDHKQVLGEELLDVYSQNGVCTADILKIFSKKDEQDVRKAVGMLKSKAPTILVLDLRDPETGYKENSKGTIAKCEQGVCDFFKAKSYDEAPKHAKKVHSAFTPDFVLCEGSLKMDLLKCGGFSASEVEYFNTPSGSKSFCQCTEFFMNAFKFGQVAQEKRASCQLTSM